MRIPSRGFRVAAVAIAGGVALAVSSCSGSGSTPKAAASGPPAVYPLTGLPSGGQARAERPALSIKIDNAGPAHPQTGLNAADIVSEQPVEGGLTRLLAVFQSADLATVGPIRSARPVDAALLRQLGGGIFAYSGAAEGEIVPVRADSHAVLLSNDQIGGQPGSPFVRSSARSAPYNLYASTTALYAAGYARGAVKRPPQQVFSYSASTPATARPATTVRMSFSSASTRSWAWDAARGLWVRSENGSLDTLAAGDSVTAANVVIMSVATRNIPGLVDAAGNNAQDVTMTGTGQCWVLRGGTVTAGQWTRGTIGDIGKLTDSAGATIALKPGRTWIELLPRPQVPTF